MPKPKILILGKIPPPYFGPAVATRILLNSNLKNNFDLFHLNTNIHKEISTIGIWKMGKIHKNIKLYWLFFKMILRIKPDIILVPISQATIGFIKDSIFILIGRVFNRKIIIQLRGSNIKNWLNESSVVTNQYFSFVIKKTQGVVVLGHKLKHLFSDYFSDDRIFVVPNGADFGYEYLEKRNPFPKILYLSNLQSSKGIEDFLNALIVLNREYKQKFQADIVGAWRDEITKKKCLEIIKTNDFPIIFHGPVYGQAKRNYFENADIFVFPPREHEGHPWVIIEAMAAGLPIITTDQGAITETVLDGVNGFIVEKKNPYQIANKIKHFLENPDLKEKMSFASRQLYVKNFTEEKMVEKISYCFNRILNES